jgi:hypothetical protein
MSQRIESKNKALVLEAFDTCSISMTTQARSAIGRLTTSSTALTLNLAEKVSSSSSRAFRPRYGTNQQRLWPRVTS